MTERMASTKFDQQQSSPFVFGSYKVNQIDGRCHFVSKARKQKQKAASGVQISATLCGSWGSAAEAGPGDRINRSTKRVNPHFLTWRQSTPEMCGGL